METSFQQVVALTETTITSSQQRKRALREFAETNGWRPSDEIEEDAGTTTITNGHLVVEHGLDNTAVITFLRPEHSFATLSRADLLRLLSVSYNNLVDWHFFPDRNGLTAVYNRSDPATVYYHRLAETKDAWRAEAYDRITGRKPNPNIKPLDDALIATISSWKRRIASEIPGVPNPAISTLFNAILFLRAYEDHRRHQDPTTPRVLLEACQNRTRGSQTLAACLLRAAKKLGLNNLPFEKATRDQLNVFDALDTETILRLILDFYDNQFAPYAYDFSLISKHALSRIYEHYVSILRDKESPQLQLFRDLPEEVSNRALGGVYTPQYVARFFVRFLRENLTPRAFRTLKAIDPTCGSGIFLRTLLEMQCDPWQDSQTEATVASAFSRVYGVDVDPNACDATRLSLSLLHLVLADKIPNSLQIHNAEALDYCFTNPDLADSFDAVIGNPPFVKWDNLLPEMRERVKTTLADHFKGKADLSIAVLKASMALAKPGGFVCFVLPQTFLSAENAAKLRKDISETFDVRVVADLSQVPVFENVGAYVILLIVQKRVAVDDVRPRATIVRCRDFVGHALQDALSGRQVVNDFYQIFEVQQSTFAQPSWLVLPPDQLDLHGRLDRLPTLDHFLHIRSGLVTGANNIFIVDEDAIPQGDRAIWVPFLSDREMIKFNVPPETGRYVFYPYRKGQKLTEEEVQKDFPNTWAYLLQHEAFLKARKSYTSNRVPWWGPAWPRPPQNLLIPKIVCPHLSLIPRFSFDVEGKYAVSHAPVLYPIEQDARDTDMLRYFLAVLNSTVGYWQIASYAGTYQRGYLLLEPKGLSKVRVPDPATVSPADMQRLQVLVRERLAKRTIEKTERALDLLVANIYGLSPSERIAIGLEVKDGDH